MPVSDFMVVAPSTVVVGEEFSIGVKALAEPYYVGTACYRGIPNLRSPFNFSPRGISYMDNVPPEWDGEIVFDLPSGIRGPKRFSFEGFHGPYKNDKRPIARIGGFYADEPGVTFLTVRDARTDKAKKSNPILARAEASGPRLYWGDLHSQTYFSDGLRCPEELYAFARDEAFLDIFALSDHTEHITDRMWDYFVAVTNDCNEPGRYVTFVGLEWTSREFGHRNVYYPGESGPILRSNDPAQRTLEQIYRVAREHGALVIPHHSANVTMGVDWTLGHDPEVERLVEIHSVWGTSEMPASQGNPRPIRTMGGEKDGQHVVDALRMGRLYGFVGGGDIHDGRPGDELHSLQDKPEQYRLLSRQGIMGVWAEDLTRESVFEALWNRRVYAVSNIRVLLDFTSEGAPMGSVRPADAPRAFCVFAASESPITSVVVMKNGNEFLRERPNRATVTHEFSDQTDHEPASYYVRIEREDGETAWSSPIWFR